MAAKRLKVGAVQLAAQGMDAAESVWPRIEHWAREAAGAGCELVVFPECSYPAYVLGSAERARGRDILGRAAIVERFGAVARAHGVTLIAGFAEDWEGKLWNSAGVWDSAGRLLGVQRKTFLFDCDNKWFSHGTSIEPIATEHGRIGIVICADARAPEVSATLVNRGAELIVVPTAWVNMARKAGEYWNVQPDCLIRARAIEFGVPYVCADKCGEEAPLRYVGMSIIASRDGGAVVQASPIEETMILGEVELATGLVSKPPNELHASMQAPYERLAKWTRGPVKIALWQSMKSERSARTLEAWTRDGVWTAFLDDRILQPLSGGIDAASSGVHRIETGELDSYHAIRALALHGARLVFVSGIGEQRLATARTRAAENRIFVGACGWRNWLIGPDGRVITFGSEFEGLEAEIDLGAADDKLVTPLTHIFSQRRPELYQFEPS